MGDGAGRPILETEPQVHCVTAAPSNQCTDCNQDAYRNPAFQKRSVSGFKDSKGKRAFWCWECAHKPKNLRNPLAKDALKSAGISVRRRLRRRLQESRSRRRRLMERLQEF